MVMSKKIKVKPFKVKTSLGERIFNVFNIVIISLCSVCALYPFINVIATAFSSSRAVSSGEIYLFPIEFNLLAFEQLLLDGQIFVAMKNTIFLTALGTAFNLVATILAAYSLSKKRMHGRSLILSMIIFTMLFNAGLIPSFILMKNLGLMDSLTGLVLQGLMSTYNMIVMKTFFEGIPPSLEEAASIDGANDPYILIKIIIPLALPVIATITLFSAVGWWNNYFGPMMYLKSSDKYTLMVKLKMMIDTAQMITVNAGQGGSEGIIASTIAPETFKAASILVSTLPIICVYPFLQKYFVKGVMVGSVKG